MAKYEISIKKSAIKELEKIPKKELHKIVKKIQGNPKVLTVHGDAESCEKFSEEIHDQFGLDAHAPSVDEIITI